MGTRGAFGVVIGEQEKIGYNQLDSYPSGHGVENLRWLRDVVANDKVELFRELARMCQVVDETRKPTKTEIQQLAAFTDLGVSEQSTQDWYCLTRGTHGDISAMLSCGYLLDYSDFPLESLFCEWAYIVDFDKEQFEVYEGFQKKLPKRGRWAGRPTAEENLQRFKDHLYWCHQNERDPWLSEVPEYKAVELVATYAFDNLPIDEVFIWETDPPYELNEQWEWSEYGPDGAKKLRNARVRALRKRGYSVKCLDDGRAFALEAVKE